MRANLPCSLFTTFLVLSRLVEAGDSRHLLAARLPHSASPLIFSLTITRLILMNLRALVVDDSEINQKMMDRRLTGGSV